MKRTKQRTFSRQEGGGWDDDGEKKKGPDKSWEEITKDVPEESFVPYSMKERYAVGTFLVHPKFGKGAVVEVEATNIVVLFQESRKKLGHGVTE